MHYSPNKHLFTLWIIVIYIGVQGDDFINDYFIYKNIQRVTLFSCGRTENDFKFLRRMNDLKIFVNTGHPQWDSYNVCYQVARKNDRPVGLLLDARCQTEEVNKKIIEQAAECHLYDHVHSWLILASNFEEITQLLNDTTYSTHTDLVLAIENEQRYELYDVYNPDKRAGGILNITNMGSWDPGNGLVVTLNQTKYYRRSNLHDLKLRIGAVVKHQPMGIALDNYLLDSTKKNKDFITKYGYAILLHLADLYNFTMEICLQPEWIMTVNGTEWGLMPELSRANIDIGASPFLADLKFANYARLSMHGYPYRTFFVLRSDFEKREFGEIFTPLAMDTWYAIGLATVLAVLVVSTIQITEYGTSWITECGHAIFAVVGVLCQQGLVFVPNRLAGRIAFLFLLFFGVLLLNYYSASVVSTRLSKPPDKMNDSLYSLALSEMEVASEDPVYVINDYLNAQSLVDWEARYFNEEVWKKLSTSKLAEVEEALDRVAKGGYAFHTSAEVSYPYIETHWDDKAICDMTEVHVITPRTLSFYERFDNPFSEMIKIGLIKTANMGLQNRMIKKWKPKTPYCSPLARSLLSISFSEISSAVVLMTIGTVIALIIFQFEKILYKIQPVVLIKSKLLKVEHVVGNNTSVKNWNWSRNKFD